METPTETRWTELQAVIPADCGSVLWWSNGEVGLSSRPPREVVLALARRLGADWGGLRWRLRRLAVNRPQPGALPLPLAPGLTLVPLPMRRGPRWGYVVLERVVFYRGLEQSPFRSEVWLENGFGLRTLAPAPLLRRAWRRGLAAKNLVWTDGQTARLPAGWNEERIAAGQARR